MSMYCSRRRRLFTKITTVVNHVGVRTLLNEISAWTKSVSFVYFAGCPRALIFPMHKLLSLTSDVNLFFVMF